jgi:hypothetical protein
LRLSKRNTLKMSKNEDISRLWSTTSTKNVAIDSFLIANNSLHSASKAIKLEAKNAALAHVSSLVLQGAVVTSVIDNIKSSQIPSWSKEVNKLPSLLFYFTVKGMLQQLPSKSNLLRWGKSANSTCTLCLGVQTNKHVLNNCSSAAALERYKIRHDAVLRILCKWVESVLEKSAILLADLQGY